MPFSMTIDFFKGTIGPSLYIHAIVTRPKELLFIFWYLMFAFPDKISRFLCFNIRLCLSISILVSGIVMLLSNLTFSFIKNSNKPTLYPNIAPVYFSRSTCTRALCSSTKLYSGTSTSPSWLCWPWRLCAPWREGWQPSSTRTHCSFSSWSAELL